MHLFVALLWALSLGEASGALLAQPAAEWRLLADLLPAEKPEPSYDVAPLRTPTLCDPSVKQYSGYLDISLGKKYFFWLMESRSAPKTDPVVMWLTGGPGCSSQLALLAENGPCSIDAKSGNTTRNPYSWTSNATVMWVDQPAGTGFSTGIFTPDTNENEVANDMYRFLQQFYKALPQYKSNPFFIFGESYAGHYVPAVAHRVWLGGKNAEGFAVPLRGIGIGNGLVDPQEQYKWYPAMAKDGGRSEGGTLEHGVITSPVEIGLMKAATVPCVAAIALCNAGGPNATKACVGAYVLCNYGELIPYQLTGMNPYDMREKCENGPLCYDFSAVDKYLNSPSVQEQLGVHKQWFSCNRIINALFQACVCIRKLCASAIVIVYTLVQSGEHHGRLSGGPSQMKNWRRGWQFPQP